MYYFSIVLIFLVNILLILSVMKIVVLKGVLVMDLITFREKEDIEFLSKLIYETIHIPVFYINKDLDIITSFPAMYTINPIYSSNDKLYDQLDFINDPLNVPVLRTTHFLENFISIAIGNGNEFQGAWILGPSVYSVTADETIIGLVNDFQVKVSMEELKHYYQSLPIINKHTLLHAGLLASYLLHSKQLSVTDIIQKDTPLKNNMLIEENPDLHVSKSRQEISFHLSYQWEQDFFQCVKEGRKEALIRKMELQNPEGKPGILSKNSYLRSEKNLAISVITLATRYAIDGGLHPEMAYTMSDLYIQGLEEIKDTLEVNSYMKEALCDFAYRVNEVKHHKYKTPIIECQSYIFKHLYEEITLEKLAKVVNMHPNYLSTFFKNEVGLNLTEYILKQKVEEAKKLLTRSDYSISEIYTWLNFHDQSHFTKVFKKHTGTTPKKYKNG